MPGSNLPETRLNKKTDLTLNRLHKIDDVALERAWHVNAWSSDRPPCAAQVARYSRASEETLS